MVTTVRKIRTFAFISAMVMLAAALQIPLFMSDDSVAVDLPIQNPSITIFDQDMTDYSALAYIGDRLPVEFSATEWIRDPDGHWFNVNIDSSNFGKTLRYGMISDITNDEIRSDILNHYVSVFTPPYFIVVQVDYELTGDCYAGVEIKKDGATQINETLPAMKDVSGYYIPRLLEQSKVFTVASTGDMPISEPNGIYALTIKANGVVAGGDSFEYGAVKYSLGGTVKDAGGKPIAGAKVAYKINDGAVTIESGIRVADASGSYVINAKKGTTVSVTSVTAENFTFAAPSYDYGSVIGDISPGPIFNSNEYYVKVTVNSQNGYPASGVEVVAAWYSSAPDGEGGYDITFDDTGIIDGVTDENGNAIVIIPSSVSGAKLLVKAQDQAGEFTFERNAINVGPHCIFDLPDEGDLMQGNRYVNSLTSVVPTELKAKEYTVEVTVAGNVDGSSVGGAPLQDVRLKAVWYYQVDNGDGTYAIREFNNKDAGTFAGITKEGKAWLVRDMSIVDGTAVVCYSKPVGSMAANESAYLFIYAYGAPASSPSSQYSFSYLVPMDGGTSIETLAGTHISTVALPNTTPVFTPSTVRSNEVAYTINGTITGDVPESVRVYCISAVSDSRTVTPLSNTFAFTVKEGTSSRIRLADTPGYAFDNQEQTLPTAMSNQSFICASSISAVIIDRTYAEILSDYTINNVPNGEILTFKFKVAGSEYTVMKRADSSTLILDVYGRVGNVVESMDVSATGVYISGFTDNVATAARLVERSFVTYFDEKIDQPTIDNVVGGQSIQIYCDGRLYTNITTGETGLTTVTVPDTPETTYKFGNLYVTSQEISTGAFNGYYGINMKDVIESPAVKEVKITVRYVAVSSLQNETEPTSKDILDSSTMTLKNGEKKQLTAPQMDGFSFSGWYINGVKISNSKDLYQCDLEANETMDGSTLTATYSADTPEPPEEDIGTTIAIGVLAVTISIIALIYVVLQIRRY